MVMMTSAQLKPLLVLTLLAGVVSPCAGADDNADSQVERFLTRLGLVDLQILHLEEIVYRDPPVAEQKKSARRLADLYAGRLMAAGEDAKEYQAVLKRIDALVAEVPEANTPALTVMLLQADYNRADALAARWIGDPADVAARDEARTILARIAPLLAAHAQQLEKDVERLTKEIDELDDSAKDARQTKERELRRLHGVARRASFFAGWSNYYLGLTTADAAVSKELFVTAAKTLRKFLDIDEGEPYKEVKAQWLGLETGTQSSAVIGLGLAEAAAGNLEGSRDCFKLLESPGVPPAVRDVAPYWYVQGLINAGRFDEALTYAKEQIDAFSGSTTQGKVSLCAALFRAGFARQGEAAPEKARELGMLGITGLTKLRRFREIRRLMEKYEVTLDDESGFFLQWLAGQQLFANAEKSKSQDDYLAAAERLTAALASPEAGREVHSAARCRNTLGWCYFRVGRYAEAARQFEQAVAGLKGAAADAAVESAWMAFLSYRKLAEDEPLRATSAVNVLTSIKRDFPHHAYAKKADYHIAKLQKGAASPEATIRSLSRIKPDQPDYLSSRYELCNLYFQQWSKARDNPAKAKDAAAEVREAVDTYLFSARFPKAAADDDNQSRKLGCLLLVAETALGSDPADVKLAESFLSKAATTAPLLPDGDSSVSRYHYLALQLAKKTSDGSAAADHARWLSRNAAGSTYEASALIALAKSIDTEVKNASADRLSQLQQDGYKVYRRLVDLWGDSKDIISSKKNARVANSKLAQYEYDTARYADAAARLEKILAVYPQDKGYLRRAALGHFKAGDYKRSLDHWRTLLRGLPEDSIDWYEAKYHQLACLSHVDKPLAGKVFRQFKLLHPELGPEAFREKFKGLERMLSKG